MTQNFPQFKNTLSEPELNSIPGVYSIQKMESEGPELSRAMIEENELICCWKPKIWSLVIGISQLILCIIGLATVFLFGQDELSEWLLLYFEGDDNREFFKWIVTFLIGLFSNGIFWGFFLYLGARYESVCLLTIWLIAEFLVLIVTGVASILVLRAYVSDIEIPFVPSSTVFPIMCLLIIGHSLGQFRVWLVFLFIQQCESNSSLKQDAASELEPVEIGTKL